MRSQTSPSTHRLRPPVAEPGRGARLLHLLMAAGGWIMFLVFWFQVFYRTPTSESVQGVLVLAVLLVLSVGATVTWVRHNILLSRRFGNRRREVREAYAVWSHDVLGRPLEGPDLPTLQEAPEIEIDLDAGRGRKVYRAF